MGEHLSAPGVPPPRGRPPPLPELETCGHEFFAFMSLYAGEIPWKFFDRGIAVNALRVLKRSGQGTTV